MSTALEALARVAATAAATCVYGGEDDLIVLPKLCPILPGEQNDDDVRAIAAIDVLRYLVENYEDTEALGSDSTEPFSGLDHQWTECPGPGCPYHKHCGHDSCAQRRTCLYS